MTTLPVFQVNETMLPDIHERKASVTDGEIPRIHKVSVSSGGTANPVQQTDDDSSSLDGSRRSSVTQPPGLPRRRPSLRLGMGMNAFARGSNQSTHGISLLSARRASIGRHKAGGRRGNSPSEEEKIELPQHPRFLALLSPEAQYSAMKCYEDIIYSEIVEKYPEYKNVIHRSNSPDNVERLAIKSAGEEQAEHTDREERTQALVTVVNRKQVIPYGRSATDMTHNRLPPISKEKRLMMTYRFQSAMDILDNIRYQTGQLITSARPNAKTLDPVHYFNMWNSHWGKEFDIVKA